MSTAKTISQVSKVARQDVYTVVSILEKMGLCEKAITKPVMFRATPIKNSLNILMKRKTAEYDELQIRTRSLLQDLDHNYNGTVHHEEGAQFLLLSERQARVLRIEEAINNASTAVDSFITPGIFKQVIVSSEEVLRKQREGVLGFDILWKTLKTNSYSWRSLRLLPRTHVLRYGMLRPLFQPRR